MSGEWFVACTTAAFLATSMVGRTNAEAPGAPDTALSRIEAMCPDALRELEELHARMKRPRVPARVSRPALRADLLLMARQDQEARAFLQASSWPVDPGNPEFRWMAQVDSRNLTRLKHILNQDGFPTAAEVGLDGVEAAWLMAIHAGADPDFQQRVLTLTTGHVRRGEVPTDQVAMLTDDLLAGRGKPQRYGTNFEMRDGELRPAPMEDEADIDTLRRSVGLGSMKNYTCFMRAMYESAERKTPGPAPSRE
jgi:hypothetical protein